MSNIDKQTRKEAIISRLASAFEPGSITDKQVDVLSDTVDLINDLFSGADAAEKQIAELQARDKPKFVQCWSCKHDIEILAIVDCDGYCPRCAAPIDLDDEPYAAAGKGE